VVRINLDAPSQVKSPPPGADPGAASSSSGGGSSADGGEEERPCHKFNEGEHWLAWAPGITRAAEFAEKYAPEAAGGRVVALVFAGADCLSADKVYSPEVGGTIKEGLL
jgi:hypothetical protein